ncbi:MAG TPA: serine protease [Phycisphaerae bacterium]|nr:serine protease [Phycisphaerae bacterium]
MISVECPKCAARLTVPFRGAMQQYRCPSCRCIFRVNQSVGWQPVSRLKGLMAHRVGRALVIMGLCAIIIPTLWGVLHHLKVRELDRVAEADLRAAAARRTEPASAPGGSAAALYATVSPAVVRLRMLDRNGNTLGSGSGFFISADGLLATCYHVIEKGDTVIVEARNGRWHVASAPLATDRSADLAVLKIDDAHTPYLELCTDMPEVGTPVYAIGSPRGLTNTLSDGLISGVRDYPRRGRVIQTTAPISSGSSGCPLLLGDGRVLGTISGGWSDQSLNFATPAERLVQLLSSSHKLHLLGAGDGKPAEPNSPDE